MGAMSIMPFLRVGAFFPLGLVNYIEERERSGLAGWLSRGSSCGGDQRKGRVDGDVAEEEAQVGK